MGVAPCVPGAEPLTLPCSSAAAAVIVATALRDSEYMEWGRTRSPRLNFFRVRGSPSAGPKKTGLMGEAGEREAEGEERKEEDEEIEGWSGDDVRGKKAAGEDNIGGDFGEWRVACV